MNYFCSLQKMNGIKSFVILSKKFYLLFVLIVLNFSIRASANEPLPSVFNLPGNNIAISDTTTTDSIQTEKKWESSDTYISGAITWENNDGSKKVDFDLRFGINLKNRLNEVDLRADARYVTKKNSPNDNEQNFRINWYRVLYRDMYLAGQGRIERNQKTWESIRLDYVILIGGIGPGYLFQTKKAGRSRLSLLYNYIQLLVLKSEAETHTFSPSIYVDNDYQLTKKLNLKNWTNIIFYAKDDVGYEMETELGYAITKNLSLGFRHYYLFNGPTLQKNNSNELKIFTKITF